MRPMFAQKRPCRSSGNDDMESAMVLEIPDCDKPMSSDQRNNKMISDHRNLGGAEHGYLCPSDERAIRGQRTVRYS